MTAEAVMKDIQRRSFTLIIASLLLAVIITQHVSAIESESQDTNVFENCPPRVGHLSAGQPASMRSFSRESSNSMTHLLLNASFPCRSRIRSWTYFRSRDSPKIFASVWRKEPSPDDYFRLVGINVLPAGDIGLHRVVIVSSKDRILVEKGDFIGFHYSGADVYRFNEPGAVLVDTTAHDTNKQPLYLTLTAGYYNENFHVDMPQTFHTSDRRLAMAAPSLQAELDYGDLKYEQNTDVCDDQTATVVDCSGSGSSVAISTSAQSMNEDAFLSIRQAVHRSPSNSPCRSGRRADDQVTSEGHQTLETPGRRRYRFIGSSFTGCSSDVTWNVAGACNGHDECTVELSEVFLDYHGDGGITSSASAAGVSPCHGGRGEYLDIGFDCISRVSDLEDDIPSIRRKIDEDFENFRSPSSSKYVPVTAREGKASSLPRHGSANTTTVTMTSSKHNERPISTIVSRFAPRDVISFSTSSPSSTSVTMFFGEEQTSRLSAPLPVISRSTAAWITEMTSASPIILASISSSKAKRLRSTLMVTTTPSGITFNTSVEKIPPDVAKQAAVTTTATVAKTTSYTTTRSLDRAPLTDRRPKHAGRYISTRNRMVDDVIMPARNKSETASASESRDLSSHATSSSVRSSTTDVTTSDVMTSDVTTTIAETTSTVKMMTSTLVANLMSTTTKIMVTMVTTTPRTTMTSQTMPTMSTTPTTVMTSTTATTVAAAGQITSVEFGEELEQDQPFMFSLAGIIIGVISFGVVAIVAVTCGVCVVKRKRDKVADNIIVQSRVIEDQLHVNPIYAHTSRQFADMQSHVTADCSDVTNASSPATSGVGIGVFHTDCSDAIDGDCRTFHQLHQPPHYLQQLQQQQQYHHHHHSHQFQQPSSPANRRNHRYHHHAVGHGHHNYHLYEKLDTTGSHLALAPTSTAPSTGASATLFDHSMSGTAAAQTAAIYAVLNLTNPTQGGAAMLKSSDTNSLMTSIHAAQLPPDYDAAAAATNYRSSYGVNCSATVAPTDFRPILFIGSSALPATLSGNSRWSQDEIRRHPMSDSADLQEVINGNQSSTSCYVNSADGRWLPMTFDVMPPPPAAYVVRRDSEPLCYIQPSNNNNGNITQTTSTSGIIQCTQQSLMTPPPTSSLSYVTTSSDRTRHCSTNQSVNTGGQHASSGHGTTGSGQQQANIGSSSGYETMTSGIHSAIHRSTTSMNNRPLRPPARRSRQRSTTDGGDDQIFDAGIDSSNL